MGVVRRWRPVRDEARTARSRLASSRALVAVAVLFPLLLGAGQPVEAGSTATESDGSGRSCPAPPEPTPVGDGSIEPDEVPAATGPESTQTKNLGTLRQPTNTQTLLRLSSPLPRDVQHLNVLVGPFQRSDGWSLEPGHVVARASVASTGRRDIVQLTMCFDPIIPDATSNGRTIEAFPGSYTGSVIIDDVRVGAFSASYTLNLKFTAEWIVYLAVALSLVVGVMAGIALSSGLELGQLLKGDTRVRALTAVFAAVAAVFAVFSAQYLQNPSWQGDVGQFAALIAACLGAAYTTSNFAGSSQALTRTDQAPAGGADRPVRVVERF